MNGPDDERLQRTSIERPRQLGPQSRFTLHHIRQFLHPSPKGPFGSLGILQDPDAPSWDPG